MQCNALQRMMQVIARGIRGGSFWRELGQHFQSGRDREAIGKCCVVGWYSNWKISQKKNKQNIYAHSEYIAMAWRRFFTSAQPPPPSLTRFLKLWTFCFKPYNLLLLECFFVFVYWDLKVKLRDLCQILTQGDSHRKMFFDSSLIGYPSRYINPREPLRLWTGNIWVGGATILCLDRRYV